MKLLDIKNNLVKISYTADEIVALGSFVVISDSGNSYVAQIVNLKAEATGNFAIAKLILTFNNAGIVDNYDGAIPSIKAELSRLDAKDLLGLLPVEKPVIMGELAQQHQIIKLDEALYEKRLLICAEKFGDVSIIVNNAVNQLNKYGEKVAVIDVDHTFTEFEPIRFRKDFKLPLTSKMIDYIYDNDLEEVDAPTKAVIQDILLEVQNYASTVDFIPIESFISVVAQQYEDTKIPELALLKNKLIKYSENNVFAQTKEDYTQLQALIKANDIIYIDIADVNDNLQKELINYIQEVLEKCGAYVYNFVKVTNKNSDKKTLLKLTNGETVFTTIICNHAYKYVSELKQLSENIIFFAPQTSQHDFAPYNTFLSKLNAGEFVIYGDLTQNIPFIVEAANIEDLETSENTVPQTTDISAADLAPESNIEEEEVVYTLDNTSAPVSEAELNPYEIVEDITPLESNNTEDFTSHDELVENIAKEVDETFISNKIEEIPPIENMLEDSGETLTEDDLDFLEELPNAPVNEEVPEQVEETTEPVEEIIEQEEPVLEDITTDFTEEPVITEDENPVEISEFQDSEISEDINLDDLKETAERTGEYSDLPVFPVEEAVTSNIGFDQGDTVSHPKYGQGVVEKLIKYGNKTLCSISFDNVGRRLLDPTISEIQKLS